MPLTDEQNRVRLKKVAVLLTLVGREAAQEIIRQFSPKDMERIGKEMAQCEEISKLEQEEVLREFIQALEQRDIPTHGGVEYAEAVLGAAMEPEQAQRFLKKIHSPQQIAPFEELQEVTPEQLLAALAGEHPQTIALIVASLPRELSARVLKQLPESEQKEVARRIAVLDQSTPDIEVVQNIERRISERIKQEEEKPELAKLGGVQTTADIFNLLDKELVHSLMDTIESRNEELAAQIKVKMVRFEDLTKLTDIEIQRLLKEVETQDLSVACIKLDKTIEEMIFRNMSSRGAEMLKDDIEVMQNTKPEAIRAARLKIGDAMRRLDEEGTIVLNKQSLEEELV